MRIGVLALQGDYDKHLQMLKRLGVEAVPVRTAEEVRQLDGLIIPGGESTTIGKLMRRFGIDEAIIEKVDQGMALYGTCAGLILMANDIEDSDQGRLGLLDITVRRNAFGRQIDSFETDMTVPELGPDPIRAVFIRAPFVTEVRNGVKTLASINGQPVLIQRDKLLASAFHPELTEDTRLHAYFLELVQT
ncbi:MAG: pyridoxal 5'-phosphate synthase glutaminase subunit PdxT [Armatimonadota bacterium]|nr:pyridoxal 5'-phosphate synthase glutaminase subunit PdxT [Armatimonadota bacterium]